MSGSILGARTPKSYSTQDGTAPDRGSLPFYTSPGGTIASVANPTEQTQIVGTGTSFTSWVEPGDWMYSDAWVDVRKITAVINDTILVIESAFGDGTPLPGTDNGFYYIPNRGLPKLISVFNYGTGPGYFSYAPIPAGDTRSFSAMQGLTPVTYDKNDPGPGEFRIDLLF